MAWQNTPYIIPLLVAAATLAILAIFAWRCRHAPGAMPSALLMLAVAEWSLVYALELGSSDLPIKVLCAKVEYLGIVTAPTMWLAFAHQYAVRERRLTRRNLALLAIEPLFTLLLVWSNNAHGLIWSSIRLDTSGSFSVLNLTHGAWFWVNIVYSYLLLLLGTLWLLQAFIRAPHLYRGQAGAPLIGAFAPWVGNALYISGSSPFPHLDLTPFAFTLTGLAMVWGLLRFRLLDIVPVAHKNVVESMRDLVFVLDAQDRIVDLNPAAQRVIGHTASKAIGQPAAQILSGWPKLVERYRDAIETHAEIVLDEDKTQRYFDMRISPLYDRRGSLTGRLVVLHDVTERKRAEEQIKASLEEKEVLLKEIHHRVKNNLQIISSLLHLQSKHIKNEEMLNMLRESQNRVKSMALVHEKLYQSKALAKINFEQYIRSLANHLFRSYRVNSNAIKLKINVDGVSLSIDTAIPCGSIINELVSNSLKYVFTEGKEGEIRIDLHSDGANKFRLIVSDNGVGFPKDLDFRNTSSLGLQLVNSLTEQLEGAIELDGSDGTEFKITFQT